MTRFSQMEEASQAEVRWPVGKQRDGADAATRFVYECQSLTEVRERSSNIGLDGDLTSYAEKRWVNLVRHDSWLALFLERPGCEAWPDPKDKRRDLLVETIPFDLKVTRYPRTCTPGMDTRALATWFYENQSGGSRFHLDNRLFVCAHREADLYNLELAERAVDCFLERFSSQTLTLTFSGNQTACAVLVL